MTGELYRLTCVACGHFCGVTQKEEVVFICPWCGEMHTDEHGTPIHFPLDEKYKTAKSVRGVA